MKMLILVRHGDDNDDGLLTEKGKQEVAITTMKIKETVDGFDCMMTSSRLKRATETSEIIGKALDIGFDESIDLVPYNAELSSDDIKDIKALVDARSEHEVVILVAHKPQVKDFGQYYVERILRLDREALSAALPLFSVPKGAAVVIDCETKQISTI